MSRNNSQPRYNYNVVQHTTPPIPSLIPQNEINVNKSRSNQINSNGIQQNRLSNNNKYNSNQKELESVVNGYFITKKEISNNGALIPIGSVGRVVNSRKNLGSFVLVFAVPFNNIEVVVKPTEYLTFDYLKAKQALMKIASNNNGHIGIDMLWNAKEKKLIKQYKQQAPRPPISNVHQPQKKKHNTNINKSITKKKKKKVPKKFQWRKHRTIAVIDQVIESELFLQAPAKHLAMFASICAELEDTLPAFTLVDGEHIKTKVYKIQRKVSGYFSNDDDDIEIEFEEYELKLRNHLKANNILRKIVYCDGTQTVEQLKEQREIQRKKDKELFEKIAKEKIKKQKLKDELTQKQIDFYSSGFTRNSAVKDLASIETQKTCSETVGICVGIVDKVWIVNSQIEGYDKETFTELLMDINSMDDPAFGLLLQMKSAVQSFTILRCYVKKILTKKTISSNNNDNNNDDL